MNRARIHAVSTKVTLPDLSTQPAVTPALTAFHKFREKKQTSKGPRLDRQQDIDIESGISPTQSILAASGTIKKDALKEANHHASGMSESQEAMSKRLKHLNAELGRDQVKNKAIVAHTMLSPMHERSVPGPVGRVLPFDPSRLLHPSGFVLPDAENISP